MPAIIDLPPEWRTRLQSAREPEFLAGVGAVLLMCAPVLPGLSRLVVLPALLLAPGYALLRLLGQPAGPRSIPVAVPISLVLAVFASLVLYVGGIRLSPLSLGLLLGAVTLLFLAGSFGRQLAADRVPQPRSTRSGEGEPARAKPRPAAYQGPPIVAYVPDGGHDEAALVAEEADGAAEDGAATTGLITVFQPASAQSPAFEPAFIRPDLPFKGAGGTRLYACREVGDLLAYLRLIASPGDEVSLRRVLNVPRRGIGDRTTKSVAALAELDKTSFAAALARPRDVPGLSLRAVRAVEAFNELLAGLRAEADAGVPVAEIAEAVLERSGYAAKLRASADPREATRIGHLAELVAMAREFDALHGQAGRPGPDTAGPAPGSLADFLQQVSPSPTPNLPAR